MAAGGAVVAEQEARRDGTDASTVPSGYRAHLDGIRALAVYLVLLYHAGVERLVGGYVGVDVFFVLSGYLVTGVLRRDLERHDGIGLARFYSRRARRLLPAASLVLVATAVVVVIARPPATWDDASDGIRAASLYVSNWFFVVRSADYFAADVAANPVLHFWSLSVEEQFYLLWPLILLGMYRATRRLGRQRSTRVIQAAAAVAALASALWARHLASVDLDRAYYGTDARAYQLLAGALLGLTPGIFARGRRAMARSTPFATAVAMAPLACVTAMVVLSSSLIESGPIARGAAVTVATVALITSVEISPGQVGSRILAWAPLAYLGRISYGTYLWHWIIVVVLATETGLATRPVAAITAAGATGLAALSHRWLEQPIRTSAPLDRRRGPVIAGGVALSLGVAFVIVPVVFDVGRARDDSTLTVAPKDRSADPDGDSATGPIVLDWQAAQQDEVRPPPCTAEQLETCIVVPGDGPRMLVIGDSHAAMFIPMFEEVARRRGYQLAVAAEPACTWAKGVYPLLTDRCQGAQADWYGPILDSLDPDIVVLAGRVLDDPDVPTAIFGEGTPLLKTGEDGYDELVAQGTRSAVELLRDQGRTVVVIEPIPQQPDAQQDPIECLSEGGTTEGCEFDAHADPQRQEVLLRELADGEGTWSLDLDRLVCPALPRCDAVVDDLITRRDRTHLTRTFSAHLAPAFDAMLDAEGVAPSAG